jgi:hypothetical protein
MKKMQMSNTNQGGTPEEMRSEYRFDYSKGRSNRFAGRSKGERLVVVLDPDIAQVFKTPESVNEVLRALITTMPVIPKAKVAVK